jgi:hypothetical protein
MLKPDDLQTLIMKAGAEKLNSILLDKQGQMKLLPAAEWDTYYRPAVRLWCKNNARYGLPTQELVAWLKDKIGGRSAIEIGSGHADLAYHLGIPATDNKHQADSESQIFYALSGQPTIQYPEWVEKIDAVSAVNKYKPDVVIAQWVTNWLDPAKVDVKFGGGCMYGVKVEEILASGTTYILIGNENVHSVQPIMKLEHKTYPLPFIRSRAQFPELDRVWVWER